MAKLQSPRLLKKALVPRYTFNLSCFSVSLLSPVSYRALFGHLDNDPNVVYFIGSGNGGPEEMVGSVDDSQYMYGLGMYSTCKPQAMNIQSMLYADQDICVYLSSYIASRNNQ